MCACEDQRGWSPHYSLPYFLRWRLLLSPGRTDWLDWLFSKPKGSSAFCPSTLELQTTPSFLTGALGIWTLALHSQHFIYWSIPQPRRWWWKISKLVSKPFKITFQLPSDSGSGSAEMARAWCLIDPVTHVMAAEGCLPQGVLWRPSECHGATHTHTHKTGCFYSFKQ